MEENCFEWIFWIPFQAFYDSRYRSAVTTLNSYHYVDHNASVQWYWYHICIPLVNSVLIQVASTWNCVSCSEGIFGCLTAQQNILVFVGICILAYMDLCVHVSRGLSSACQEGVLTRTEQIEKFGQTEGLKMMDPELRGFFLESLKGSDRMTDKTKIPCIWLEQ